MRRGYDGNDETSAENCGRLCPCNFGKQGDSRYKIEHNMN
jgi:hypothetical protein